MALDPCVEIAAFSRLSEVAADPSAEARRLAKAGSRVLGLLCPNLPEELPHAMGLSPFRVVVRPTPPTRSAEHLQTFSCTWVQAVLDQALRGAFAHLWGLVFPCNTCDSFQNLPDIWSRSVEAPGRDALYTLHFPIKTSGAAPLQMLEAELEAWRRWLEQRTGRELAPEALAASARLYNRIHASLRRLQAMASAGALPYLRLQSAAIAAQCMDRAQVADLLDEALEQLPSEGSAQTSGLDDDEEFGRARVMIVGGYLDDPLLLTWLHEHDADVVADDTCALDRIFQPEADLDPGDPLAEMARRHLRRSPCPVHLSSAERRAARLLRQIRKHRVQGVIFVPYKGCEPHAFDNVILAEALDRRRPAIPHITLEVEPHLGSWGQLSTRLEAFIEMLAGPDLLDLDDLDDLEETGTGDR